MTAKAIPAALRKLVLERDGYACARCRQMLQGNYYPILRNGVREQPTATGWELVG